MARTDFDALPDDARCWVFAADRRLEPPAAAALLTLADDFLAEWRAHGAPLHGARDWRDGQFLAIAVDERATGASGCSVDALFRSLKQAEPSLGVTFVSGGRLFWRAPDGAVHGGSRAEFTAALASGAIGADTPVFDPTITTVGAWRGAFEKPLRDSWHARLSPLTRVG